ncbi:MAG: type IV toxin-antitoxin system AbiEi family antitoxin [Cytophagales bacterium]|nr:type IV toxin-antitoxin system AbiEi family antitoxin [Cytophagales bacterium]
METRIVHTALENLRKHTGIEGIYTATQKKGLDGEVEFVFQNGKERFTTEVKRELRNHQLEQIKDRANKKHIIIAETIFPKIKEALRNDGIGYLDMAGNVFLRTAKHHVWIEGHKAEKTQTEKPNRAFSATGLKVIYLLLTDDQLVNQPQRMIAEAAGVALGNINYILNGLREQKFLIQKIRKAFMLVNRKQLLDKWLIGFEERLKPTLHIGNFRLLRNEDYNQWKNIPLQKHQAFWGGEPAGALITGYLLPEIFTIYTEETRNDLIKNYRLVPDTNGNIRVYKKFWKGKETFNETVVHPLLAYTDLMNTGDRRNTETAQKIYDELLHNRFQ